MSVTGLCSVCENREAEFVCERCGAAVCTVHYDSSAGICTNCAAEVGGGADETDGGHSDEHRI